MPDLTQEEWTKQLAADNNAVIIDVRTNEEVAAGIIPGALHIDIYKGQGFVNEVDALDKDRAYYVYCRSGARSANACSFMNKMGFNKTFNLIGGILEWNGDIAEI